MSVKAYLMVFQKGIDKDVFIGVSIKKEIEKRHQTSVPEKVHLTLQSKKGESI